MLEIRLQPTLAGRASHDFGEVPTDDSVAKTANPVEEITGLVHDTINEEAEAP